MTNDLDPTIPRAPVEGSMLLAAALAGLLSVAGSGCADEGTPSATTEDGPVVISSIEDRTMTFDRFSRECDERGGLVQTHAVCGGTNACRGMSFNKWSMQLSEHTCRGMNTCAGMSCVDLAQGKGRSGAEVYKESCAGCHGGDDTFAVFVPKGSDLAAAAAEFPGRPRERLLSSVAFGMTGLSDNGVPYSNMPPHYATHSRRELEAVVTYVLTLRPEGEEFGVVGLNEELGEGSGSM